MATIALYKNKINGVGSLLDDIIKSSNNLDVQLGTLKRTLQGVDSSTCNLQDTVDSISSSSKGEKDKIADLKKLNSRLTEFIEMTTNRDASAKSEIERAKKDFYKKYSYLKPECEKSTWEKIKEAFKKVGKWCKEKFSSFLDFCSDVFSFLGKLFSTLGKCLWEGLKGFGKWLWHGLKGLGKWLWGGFTGYFKWIWHSLKGLGSWCLGFFDAIRSGPLGLLKWLWGGAKDFLGWLKGSAKDFLGWLKGGAKSGFTWVLEGIFDFNRAINKDARRLAAVFTGPGHPTYTYDTSDPSSMAECLGIDYDEYLETMSYNYGFEKEISDLYLKLYLQIANDPDNAYMNEREVACEFNRMIASLCIKYSATRWHLTTGNYSTADAYKMLMADYGFTKEQATDFITALNIQHGIDYDDLEADLKNIGYSHTNGNLYKEQAPNKGCYETIMNTAIEKNNKEGDKKIVEKTIMRDFVHEAVQFVEFNDSYDPVDIASGSTDRMISYSGDIISTRNENDDKQSDIDANNIQERLRSSDNNFIKVQQDYNYGVMNGKINSKKEFINNNGGIDNIRNNINSDLRSMMGNYMREHEYDFYEQPINDFIDFLNQSE